MPLLTKKFTRDSLKRANGSGALQRVEDHSKADMIQREMTRARARSLQSRKILNQKQRRHRSVSRGPSSPPLRSSGMKDLKVKPDPERLVNSRNLSHPNDEFSDAFNDVEVLTQMSSLTEPTWAPSVVGGSDVNSAQRGQTAKYTNSRYQIRFQRSSSSVNQNRATLTTSTSKDKKETKGFRLEKRTNCDKDEHREDDESTVSRFSKNVESGGMREVLVEKRALTTSRSNLSGSSRRSKVVGGADDESNASRTRGRSGRRNSNRNRKKRPSSISSKRSKQSTVTTSTAPTIAKDSSTLSSRSASLKSRKLKAGAISAALRSASVPPSTSNSKRGQRTSSVPPNVFDMKEMRRNEGNSMIKADISLGTAPTMEDLTAVSSQSISRSNVPFVNGSRSFSTSVGDSNSGPSSEIEAARISLRGRLCRSNSNRSFSSAQSGSISSRKSNRPYDESNGRAPKAVASTLGATTNTSRMHKLAQDARTRRIRKQRLMQRKEHQVKEDRKHQKAEKNCRNDVNEELLKVAVDVSEPHPTKVTTLIFDLLVFQALILLDLPKNAVLAVWSLVFSKKWTSRRKNVLLTFANSALGVETARQFATEGANLILVSHVTAPSEDGLNWLVEECQALGSGKAQSYSTDLSNAVSIELTLRQAAKDFDGTFDIVVLNGETRSHGCLFEEIHDVHQIEKMVTENTLGCIMALHYSLKHIPKSSDSRVVILSSASGVIASPYRSVYGATQHALKGFCDSIRIELNDKYTGRRAPKICFALLPDLVGQNMQSRDGINQRLSQMGADTTPMKTRSWAGVPLQEAVRDLLEAISSGKRDFGAPRHVNFWRFMQVLAPRLVDFSIFRHFQRTLYRPSEKGKDIATEK